MKKTDSKDLRYGTSLYSIVFISCIFLFLYRNSIVSRGFDTPRAESLFSPLRFKDAVLAHL